MSIYDFIDDVWLPWVLMGGFTLADIVMDAVEPRMGTFAGIMASIALFPVMMAWSFLGFVATGIAIAVVIVVSPLILPFTIYSHVKGRKN